MRTSRIFVSAPLRAGAQVALDAAASHYLSRVLRVAAGDPVVLFDGSGTDYAATIATADRRGVVCTVDGAVDAVRESPVPITLIQGISRGEKMDLTIQKATELGVAAIRPVLAERGVVRLSAERAASRAAHWRKVAINACQQCGRSVVPAIEAATGLDEALRADASAVRLVALPDAAHDLGEALRRVERAASVSILVGPEGGFSDREAASAREAGLVSFRAGPRVLRTETAAIALIAILQYAIGDLS